MIEPDASWEQRLAALWKSFDDRGPEAFIAELDQLLVELPAGSAIALFERGAAHDSTGRSDLAVPLYEAALAAGLSGVRRRRAVIQMASSLRNLGHAARAAQLLEAELALPEDDLTQAVRAFLSLALVDLGRERDAVTVGLTALSHYLPRYNRSLARYARTLHESAGNPIPLRDIDHLVLRVVDLDRMLAFYCDALGCTIERRQDDIGLVQLRAGRSLIDLVPLDGKLGREGGSAPDPQRRNLDHFCLRVDPFDEPAIRAYLRAQGVQAGPVEQRYGADGTGPSIYLADPEGNTVELKGPPCA